MEFLFFFSQTCQPCKSLKPTVETFGIEQGVPVRFIDALDEANAPLLDRYTVRMVPTVVLCKDGDVVQRTHGLAGWDSAAMRARIASSR